MFHTKHGSTAGNPLGMSVTLHAHSYTYTAQISLSSDLKAQTKERIGLLIKLAQDLEDAERRKKWQRSFDVWMDVVEHEDAVCSLYVQIVSLDPFRTEDQIRLTLHRLVSVITNDQLASDLQNELFNKAI